VPVKIEMIQLVAQLFLLGDVILIAMVFLKVVGNILKNLLIIVGLTFLIMLVVYMVSNYDKTAT